MSTFWSKASLSRHHLCLNQAGGCCLKSIRLASTLALDLVSQWKSDTAVEALLSMQEELKQHLVSLTSDVGIMTSIGVEQAQSKAEPIGAHTDVQRHAPQVL